MALARIKLLRNKRDAVVKQIRRDIAMLLQSGQDATARIRVEHVIREQNIMVANEFLELFCELVVSRLSIITKQRNCPEDLKEGLQNLIFAAPRCADIPELTRIRDTFEKKYGKDFVSAASDLRPDSGVNRMSSLKYCIVSLSKLSGQSDPNTGKKVLRGDREELEWYKDTASAVTEAAECAKKAIAAAEAVAILGRRDANQMLLQTTNVNCNNKKYEEELPRIMKVNNRRHTFKVRSSRSGIMFDESDYDDEEEFDLDEDRRRWRDFETRADSHRNLANSKKQSPSMGLILLPSILQYESDY